MTGESPMPDPAEDVPADAPTGQGDRRFDHGTLGLGMPGTAWIGAMVELADEMDRTIEGEEVAMAVVADVHFVTTVRAVAIDDVKFPEGEVGILRPEMRHDVDRPVVRVSFVSISKLPRKIREKPSSF